MKEKTTQIIFSPDNEPYLGELMLYQLDNMIVCFSEKNSLIARYTIKNKDSLTSIEQAGCSLIPAAFSLILAIRELLRQGYLYGAAVLLRPVVERVAIISYLCDKPESLSIWQNGWVYKERPTFSRLIDNMGKNSPQTGKHELIKMLHSLVHGGEDSLSFGAVKDDLGSFGFSSGKVTDNPAKCNDIALLACMMLIVLLARRTQVFPDFEEKFPSEPPS